MKYKILATFFLLLILVLFPQSSKASCYDTVRVKGVGPESCAQARFMCPQKICCDSSNECANAEQILSDTKAQIKRDIDQRDFSGAPVPYCGTNGLGVNTAFGCLMAGNPKQLISQLLNWGVVVGGGISFLMIIFAGFQMTTAGGDPKKVQAAQELMVSAISGLILIVLSVVFLNFVGVSVLGLDTLGFQVGL